MNISTLLSRVRSGWRRSADVALEHHEYHHDFGSYRRIGLTVGLGCLSFAIFYVFVIGPAGSFPERAYFKIRSGETLTSVAERLEEKHIVRSVLLFKTAALLVGSKTGIVAGEYYFESPQNLISIAIRMTHGAYGITPVKIRIREGATVRQIGDTLEAAIPDFDASQFRALTADKEGYLFPDTYFFYPGVEAQEVVLVMERNFEANTAQVRAAANLSKRSFEDVLIMASLIEREASDTKNRRVIAGILWNRLDSGMLLQVDSSFSYILEKSLTKLTTSDLRMDSPYNTYVYKGLPPSPIGNPSLDAIEAAANPIYTDYVYYLSDRDGEFHYATTYAQHLANKKKYLP